MVQAINTIMDQAQEAFLAYQRTNGQDKRVFLYTIAEEIEALGDELLATAASETNLPFARFKGERDRTCGQLRSFGDLIGAGDWVEAVIDHALVDRRPLPRPDMRKMLVGLGPIVVFGASNFPLAYSTAGGDTASALAAGCSVVVKGHPFHPKTSALVASAISNAVVKCNLHPFVFQHIQSSDFEVGKLLTQHPHTAGVGFTGSLVGGRAIFDYAQQRAKPIPVFSEMGSTNPVILLPDALITKAEYFAKAFAGSITIGVGQFCTNPGIMLGVKGAELDIFMQHLATELSLKPSFKMLHDGIHKNYISKLDEALSQKGVQLLYHAQNSGDLIASQALAMVDGQDFINNPSLHHEIFGPFSIIVTCEDMAQLVAAWQSLHGQLTTTFIATNHDMSQYPNLMQTAIQLAGRVVFNYVPTGVEVSNATVHGGPYPATTDSRFTSVGMDAIKRWVRPVCFQDCPDFLLPDELKDSNPLGILRKIDGKYGWN